MNMMLPAIEILEHRAGELREQLRGIEAAITVLRGSTSLTPLLLEPPAVEEPKPALPRSATELYEAVGGVDRVLAAIGDLGAKANVTTLAVRLVSPRDLVAELLAHMELCRRIRVIALGPRKGEIVRLDPPAKPQAPPAAERPPVDLVEAIRELGPRATDIELARRAGFGRSTLRRQLRDLEAAGRIRRSGSTMARRLELVDAAIGAEPALMPVPESGPEAAVPPPVAVEAARPAPTPAPRRRTVEPASAPRSTSNRPVEPREAAPAAAASKFRKPVAADEAAAIARHMAAKGASKYEPGTMLAVLERTFVGAGKTFGYQAGPRTARTPYVINGQALTPGKAIEQANEIRARAGLEPIAVPGRLAKGAWR